jgi:hypothetical protein
MRSGSQAQMPWIGTSGSARVPIACGRISAPAAREPARHTPTDSWRAIPELTPAHQVQTHLFDQYDRERSQRLMAALDGVNTQWRMGSCRPTGATFTARASIGASVSA